MAINRVTGDFRCDLRFFQQHIHWTTAIQTYLFKKIKWSKRRVFDQILPSMPADREDSFGSYWFDLN